MSSTFFTSDHHFGHRKIIEHCRRPFASAEEMDLELIKRWNNKVGVKDEVYHLGDLVWGGKESVQLLERLLEHLNGTIRVLIGDHDGAVKQISRKFKWVGWYKEIKIDRVSIVLFHWPLRSWHCKYYGAWHLHGHCHGTAVEEDKGYVVDVGVDTPRADFAPIAFEELREEMRER